MIDIPVPVRLESRPRYHGYVIPFTTMVGLDGVPNFKVTDTAAWDVCVNEKLCATCGKELDYWVWYLGSQEHIKQQQFFDLAMHKECAEYAICTCPYIAHGKAYGDYIKPVAGAHVVEIAPRNELSNEGVPIYLARGRRDAIKPFIAARKINSQHVFSMVKSGTLQDVELVGYHAKEKPG